MCCLRASPVPTGRRDVVPSGPTGLGVVSVPLFVPNALSFFWHEMAQAIRPHGPGSRRLPPSLLGGGT